MFLMLQMKNGRQSHLLRGPSPSVWQNLSSTLIFRLFLQCFGMTCLRNRKEKGDEKTIAMIGTKKII